MALKKLHKFKIDDKHNVIVYDNNSKSNYNRFVSVIEGNNTNSPLWGTTCKSDTTKSEYLEMGRNGLKLYLNQEPIL